MNIKNFFLAATLLVATACTDKNSASLDQTFTSGTLSVSCSSNWHQLDNPFSDDMNSDDLVYMSKGSDSLLGLLSGNYSTLMVYHSADEYEVENDKAWISSPQDMDIDVNGTKWTGFTYTNGDNANFYNTADMTVKVIIFKGKDYSIDYQGEELKAILGSIKAQPKEKRQPSFDDDDEESEE